MGSFTENMRTTLIDMARTIRAQVEIERSKRPDLDFELLAVATTATLIEEQAAESTSLTSTQLIGLMGDLKDAMQDMTLLTGS